MIRANQGSAPLDAPAPLDALESTARTVRSLVVELSHRGPAPHLGSSLSCVDALVSCYFDALAIDPARPEDPARDRFILSKGHAAAALYATLAVRGFFPVSRLARYCEPGSGLPEQPAPGGVPGVELATGSLGHGLPVGVGLALGARIRGIDPRVVVLVSDGECNEGSVWEAAMLAAAQELSSLAVIVDANGWQATGRTQDVLALEPLADKWRAFGWDTAEIDGHDLAALGKALRPGSSTRPRAVIARTVKGKGVSFMEDDNNWHYRIPTEAEVVGACGELGVLRPILEDA